MNENFAQGVLSRAPLTMKKVIFRKIQNDHNKLRDDVIQGTADELPSVGKSFVMTAPPRDAGDIRLINTSPVTEIVSEISFDKGKVITFKTKSGSTYSVEEL